LLGRARASDLDDQNAPSWRLSEVAGFFNPNTLHEPGRYV